MRREAGSLAGLCFFAALSCAVALAANFKVPPRPQTEVVDAAGAMSADARAALETELEDFEAKTGHHVVVYIAATTGGVPLEMWTAQTAQAWKVGQTGRDDGAVLFLFMKDHKVRIEVGYGLESSLTDANASQIINDTIVPRMKNGDTDGAVTGGVADMLTTIAPNYDALQAAEETAPRESFGADFWSDPLGFLSFFFFLCVVFFTLVISVYAHQRYEYLIRREGAVSAAKDMRKSWMQYFLRGGKGGAVAGSIGGSIGGGFSGGGGGGFSGGSFGGGFGGGGASGSW